MSENGDVSFRTPALRVRWDVFINFRGFDTRDTFTQHLHDALLHKGVRPFLDDNGLTQGDSLGPTLLNAIEDSAASISIISPNYASSRWCLEELATICELKRLVLPVFYKVEPSDVRRQRGPFEQDFESLKKKVDEEKVLRWRSAMEEVGGKKGLVLDKDSEEPQLIQHLVKMVLAELNNTPVALAPYTVGLNFPLNELMELLDVKGNGIQVLGVHGMGGIGKTTLSKALYNKLASHFEHRSFISNVREKSAKQNGLVSIQNKLIRDLSQQHMPVNDVDSGKVGIKEILHQKSVLVVLDDVDSIRQLDALVCRKEWIHKGSRIIINTRDLNVLPTHLVDRIYEVRKLGFDDSLKLFSYYAFRREKPPTETYLNLSHRIVHLTDGLPLSLEIFGSFLFDKRRVEEWNDALQKLKQIRPGNLQDILKISFDGLDDEEKCIFLDIACLFIDQEMKKDDVIDVMKGSGFGAEIAITELVSKSLVKIMEDDKLWMHDQIRDMGRQIVLQENHGDPGMRSRLWDHGDVLGVLQDGKGTRYIQGIILDFEKKNFPRIKSAKTIARNNFQRSLNLSSALIYLKEIYREYFQHSAKHEGEVKLFTVPFEPMVNLRLLQLSNVKLEGSFKHLPSDLKWLQWKGCSLRNFPSEFCPQKLTVLDLSESKIERVWGRRWWCWYSNKVATKMMVMNLRGCHNITTIPDLSGHPALEKLILERCSGLASIHKSVGDLSMLRQLNLRECSSLVEFPSDVSGLKHLENFILSGCSKLKDLPQDIGSMNSLTELLIDETAIEMLPESIFRLTKLETLSLNRCHSLKRLPICIGKLVSLKELSLNGSALEEIPMTIGYLGNLENFSLRHCRSLSVLPNSVGNLKSLTEFWLSGSSVEEIPDSIGSLAILKHLSVGGCSYISTLPSSIEGLNSLIELQLDRTLIKDLPDQIGALKSLQTLEMMNCESLSSLPESMGNLLTLTKLIIVNAAIIELPESLGMLENLVMLKLNKCKKLYRLPGSIGKLKTLHRLLMRETAVTELPESFGMLSNLRVLNMAKKPYHEVPQNVEITEQNVLGAKQKSELIVLPSSFSKLSLLAELDACAWKISGKIPDDFEKLSSLEMLNLGHNDFCSLPSSLAGLSVLKKLFLPNCKQLKVIPPLPSSLVELNAANCEALECMSNLSNLENLRELHLTNCEKLGDIPGVEHLKSLRRLLMGGCNLCSSMVTEKLDKIAFRNMLEFTIPGREIPTWFTQEVVCFSKRRNHVLKSLIIGVIISINHEIQDDLRDELPVIPDILATLHRLDEPVHTVCMHLTGVPKTNEGQLYLCRYPYDHPLVSTLRDGDRIQVARRNPPFVKGVELKKSGIYLVFENDDDYDGNEESLNESQQSVSERLTNFIRSSEADNRMLDSNHEVDEGMEEREQVGFLGEIFGIVKLLLRRFSLPKQNREACDHSSKSQ